MSKKSLIRRAKDAVLWAVRIPERTMVAIYQAARHGKIPFPDKAFVKWDYKLHTGRKLNLKKPTTFQEKLQWLKLNYRDPSYSQLVDKYGAREVVAAKIGEQYLVPIYGVYNSFDEIDFDALPDMFVLKCTHDSGSVVFCRDKASFDKQKAREVLEKGLACKQFYLSREWPYKNVKPRIIAEHFLVDETNPDTPDYKFFCFDGEPKVFLVNSERHSETGVKTNYYTMDWKRIPMREVKYPNNPKDDIKPAQFDEMVRLAKILSEGMPHVRIDFNLANDHIYFGEVTFYHGGGRLLFEPDEYNKIFGDWITLPEKSV